MRPLLLLLPLLASCQLVKDCTLIGCVNQLTIEVTGAGAAIGLSGSVTLSGHTFVVDCANPDATAVVCDGTTLIISLADGQGGGDVQWSLSADGADTGRQGYAGEGTFTPNWVSSEPNGPDCGPLCISGAGEVELLGTP